MNQRSRVLVAAATAAVLAGAAAVYIATSAPADPPVSSAAVQGGPRLQVLTNGKLSTVSMADPRGPRAIQEQQCDRASAAGDTVACLRPVDALTGTQLVIFDAAMRERSTLPLTGFPNRLRVSASGRMVSWTLFIDSHSYATTGFSTRTGILDTRTGARVDTLEEFTAYVDGRVHQAADVNLWGVTFTSDDNRFYATLSTEGRRHLVEGDVAARTVRTLATNVECPSLSPDGTRVAYKAAIDGDPKQGWRLSVLDLATRQVTATAETRSVDDQAIWFDDRTVGYSLQRGDGTNDVWSVPADGTGSATLVVEGANSPALSNRLPD